MAKKKASRVNGVRVCLQCKGICHENSLRKKIVRGYGSRSHYFCSKRCFEIREELGLEKTFDKLGYYRSQTWFNDYFKSAEWKKTIRERMKEYERVDCITD